MKDDVTSFNKKQVKVNVAVAGTVSALQDDVQALKDNRDFVKISRHSLEDLEPHEQELLAGWLQKLMLELDARGFAASVNQQEFLINFFNFIGVRDVLMQQQHGLDMLENFGGNELHEAIYKIFLSLCYLHDNNFDILSRLEDIDQMFKLNVADKSRIKALLENERIPALGVSGLIRMFDPTQPINSFSVESLISRNLNISSHPLLSLRLSKADYSIYLKTFAIFAPKKSRFTEKQHTYVVALANLFGCPECVFEFDKQCLNPQNVNIGAWRNFLDTDEKKYAWALDAAVLLGLNPDFDPEDDEVLEQTLKGVRISGASDFIAAAVGLTRETNSVRLYEQIVKVYGYCKGWEHVVEFCGSNLHGAFSELRNRLTKFELDLSGLSWELAKLNMNIPSDNRYVVDTSEFDSAVEKAFSKVNSKVIESGRAGHLNDLLGFRKKVEQLFEANSETLDKANAVLRVFGFESIGQRHLGFRDFNLDHSVANEEWSDHYDRHSEQINKTIEDVSETANLLEDQLCIFEDGEIYVSVSTKRQQEKEVREKQKRMELEAKRFVKVGKGENAKSVSIVWSDIEGLPFKPKDIFSLASDGNGWMALVDYWIDEGGGCFTNDHSDLYFSKDGNNWTSVEMPVSDRFSSISYLNGTWILKESRDDIYFSTDGKNWLKGKMPDSRLNDNIAVHFFDGQWLIVGKENREYTYTKEGMIWDSTETNDYDSPVFYRGESLQGPWKKWKKASNLKNGLVISSKSFGVRDNLLVAGFATDWLYSNLKKCPEDYYVSCITPQGTWTRVTWPKEKCPDNFHVWGTKNICLEGDDIITSENGYEWTKVASKISSTDALLDVGDFLFLPPHSGNKAYLSNDGVNFSEIALSDTEPCAWENFTTNGKEILATLKISEKEVFLRKGIIQILD